MSTVEPHRKPVLDQPYQYGGHEFHWSESWLLPPCARCGRPSETEYFANSPHPDGYRVDPPHPVPCVGKGHWQPKYPVCEGNKVAVLTEQLEAERERLKNATASFASAHNALEHELERVHNDRQLHP
jgi:hypothetical protein